MVTCFIAAIGIAHLLSSNLNLPVNLLKLPTQLNKKLIVRTKTLGCKAPKEFFFVTKQWN